MGLRAAQYVRMSTDLQRYSTENQAAAIAAYAARHNLTIVRTYADEGRSGLQINGRQGLLELIDDVRAGRADFDRVLVCDVSRWGRSQDTDESAYYEYICKDAGIRVEYCAEEFENDGSLISTIIKSPRCAPLPSASSSTPASCSFRCSTIAISPRSPLSTIRASGSSSAAIRCSPRSG